MYAVFEDGSRQYRVSEGEHVDVDYREAEPGTTVTFERVLVVQGNEGTKIGQPHIGGARVVCEVVGHPSEKTFTQKYRRRKNYRRFTGHRQHYTTVKINHILLPGQEVPPPPPKEEPAAPPAPAPAAAATTPPASK
jgi:large subunit ribosomal protein L21